MKLNVRKKKQNYVRLSAYLCMLFSLFCYFYCSFSLIFFVFGEKVFFYYVKYWLKENSNDEKWFIIIIIFNFMYDACFYSSNIHL